MSFITDLFSGGASTLVDSVGGVLGKVITTKGEKMELENEIKKAEMNHQVELQKLSVQDRQNLYQEVASARNREVTLSQSANATNLGKNISSYLALGATILCFALFYILIFQHKVLDPSVEQIVLYILGVLSALLTQIFSYYFGSSAGSKEKSQTIKEELLSKG